MNQTEQLIQRIQEQQSGRGAQFRQTRKWSYTLEPGRGQTYCNGKPTLYGHNVYPRGSVLAGRPQRVWLEQWEEWPEARQAIAEVKKAVRGFRCEDYGPEGGSSHVDIDTLTAGLPEDGDY